MLNQKTKKVHFYRYLDLEEAGIVNNRVTLSRWIKKGDFPAPVQLGPNSIGWLAHEVDEWIKEKASARQEV